MSAVPLNLLAPLAGLTGFLDHDSDELRVIPREQWLIPGRCLGQELVDDALQARHAFVSDVLRVPGLPLVVPAVELPELAGVELEVVSAHHAHVPRPESEGVLKHHAGPLLSSSSGVMLEHVAA